VHRPKTLSAPALLAIALLVCPPGLGAASPPSPGEELAEGIRLHNEALSAPTASGIREGKALLGKLSGKSPVAKAYLGSLLSVEASLEAREKNGIRALALLEESARLIDEAVAEDPGNLEIRILRVENSYGVSSASPADRWAPMEEDLYWLEERRPSLSRQVLGILDLYNGKYLASVRDIDGALEAWEACLRESPGSPEAAEACSLLALYGD